MNNNTGTCETMSLTHWRSAVLEEAHVSEDDADQYATRERVTRWFNAGEPVWMAAESLRTCVKYARLAERADGDVVFLKRVIRNAVRK